MLSNKKRYISHLAVLLTDGLRKLSMGPRLRGGDVLR
jgi:hypothetical protein